MPANFPEVWLNRVRTLFTTQDSAPWLDGVEELNTPVFEALEGQAGELNQIHIPTSEFEVDVLVNNTTYPIPEQAYDDDSVTITLDKYQTKATTISDDAAIGASYPIIDAATKPHLRDINKKKFRKAAHAIAPQSNTVNTPVLEATGEVIGTRKRMTYADLVAMKDAFDKMEAPVEGRRVVLSPDHYNDLLLDRQNFADRLIDHAKGQTVPVIAGFEIHQYVGNPLFDSAGAKKAFGAVEATGDRKASFFFTVENIVKKTGSTKQYFDKADTKNQTNRLNYRHYFIALPVRNKYIGATY
jgi:hypothetical protein